MSFINSEQTCGIILKSVSRSERSESHRREFGSERGDITCKDGNPGRTGVAVEREHQPVTIHKSGNRVGFDSAARVASKVYHGGSVQNVYKTITGQPWETALAFTPWRKQFVAVCETVSGPFARYVEAPIRHSTGIAAWRPAWVCPRCGEEAGLDDVDVPPQAGDPCEGCGAIQQWAFDRFTARGELSCTAACAPAGFSADAAPPPAPPAVAPGASGQPSTVGGSFRNVPGARTHCDVWAMCGLPQGVPAPTNSWLYVPLLPAAAGQLQGPALQQWREDPRTVPWWEHAHTALVTSDPVLVATLVEAFVAAVTHAGEALPQELLAEASALPRNTSVHLGWVVRNLLQPDGYITAACQEVCLQLFGGRELPTELNRLSDAFRPPAPLPPSDADEEHAAERRHTPAMGSPPSPSRRPVNGDVREAVDAEDVAAWGLPREATAASCAGGNRPGPGTGEQARAARAVQLVQLGELSAAARALTAATQGEMPTPSRNSETLIGGRLQRKLAAGPSGATNEHLRLLLDDPSDCALLHRAAERWANADPEQVLQALRLGRMVARRKPNGRVRALVVGDVFRRLVARALAQHFAGAFQDACLPYQFGLSTRAGTEGLYKLLHTAGCPCCSEAHGGPS
eukprot:s1645_g1.t1